MNPDPGIFTHNDTFLFINGIQYSLRKLFSILKYHNQSCGAGTFWPEPVWRSGSSFSLENSVQNFLHCIIDRRKIKKIKINDFFSPRIVGKYKKNFKRSSIFFIGAQTGHEAGKNQTGFAIQITNIRYPEPCYLANLIFLIVNLYPYRTIVFTFFFGWSRSSFQISAPDCHQKKRLAQLGNTAIQDDNTLLRNEHK